MLDGTEKQEIIIIKRGGDGDGGHHGGAWKIAFADFMTAMMALFLVLWLVNAANEETKKSVASYFNPVKLVDRNPSSRGLDDAEGLKTRVDEPTEDAKDVGDGKDSSDPVDGARSDIEMFRDPFKVLNQIATDELTKAPEADFVLTPPSASGSPQEDAFLDPFAQLAPPIEQDRSSAPTNGGDQDDQTAELDLTKTEDAESRPANFKTRQEAEDAPGSDDPAAPQNAVHRKVGEADTAENSQTTADQPKAAQQADDHPMTPKEQEELRESAIKEAMQLVEKKQSVKKLTGEIAEEIKQKLAEKLEIDGKLADSLTVEATSDGVLISITDQLGFSMFEIGSARPRGQLVLAMDQISAVLTKKQGAIRIYGHTDARPYQGDDYDNWRLSTARAHAARFMLERGGLGEKRISRVAGFADRKLRIPDDPEADANRRIEILLEVS